MTDLTEALMAKLEDQGSNGRTVLWIILIAFGIIMTAGAIAGFVGEHRAQGDRAFSDFAIGFIAGLAIVMAAMTVSFWRYAKKLKASGEPMSRREKLNRNIILACGLLGGVMGAVMAAGGFLNAPDKSADPLSVLFTGPMPVAVALALVFFWAVVMPVVAWFWHTRAIDEQEASAYRDGGYYAAYAYLILAPVWWLLWRGGLLPEPNGVAIFLTFAFIWSAVWMWKKYR
jgi:hypothetical protein